MSIEEEIKKLERKQFMLAMKDTWDSSDYRYDDELTEQIKELKRKLEGETNE